MNWVRLCEVARPENYSVEGSEETIALQAVQITTGASFERMWHRERHYCSCEMFDKRKTKMIAWKQLCLVTRIIFIRVVRLIVIM